MHQPLFKAAGLALLTLLLAACAGGPSVTVTRDPDIDLSAYRTFGFVEPLSIEDDKVRKALGGLLAQSTAAELQARGLTRSNEPDVFIDFAVRPPYQQTARDRSPSPGPINAGIGRSSGWSPDPRDVPYEARQTPKDTVTLNVIDARLERTVRAAEVREYVTSKSGDELEATVAAVVAALLAQYPN